MTGCRALDVAPDDDDDDGDDDDEDEDEDASSSSSSSSELQCGVTTRTPRATSGRASRSHFSALPSTPRASRSGESQRHSR